MNNALIGYTGFVGSTLLKQHKFGNLYNSKNSIELRSSKRFDTVVCAGASAMKWLANKNPELDERSIDALIENLQYVDCDKFILISTVDVFDNPVGVDEDFIPKPNNAYGYNRYRLEEFVKTQFEETMIVRLPGLVGPGLRKNIIFDMSTNNNLEAIDPESEYQFYPMVNLWSDVEFADYRGTKLVHLTSEPIRTEEIADEVFNITLRKKDGPHARYDFRSKYAWNFGGDVNAGYTYSRSEVMIAIRSYAQST